MGFKNMRIGQRLMLSFGAVIALMLVLAAVTYTHVGSLATEVGLMNTDRYPKILLANSIKA
ncbi:MAG TPA: methyl-accepting chemotaxis protein, partial [Burkholderiaceae bacterium]